MLVGHDQGSREDFMLTRLLGWAGVDRSTLLIVPSLPSTIPPEVSVIMPLGEEGLREVTGRGGILTTRGYVRPGPLHGTYVLPTISPSFILRGQSKLSPVFINDVRKAVRLCEEGLPTQFVDYVLDPLPHVAFGWASRYRETLTRDPSLPLAFDIETPYADVDESERGEDDSWKILRISFSFIPYEALSIPFTPPYMAAIRLLLEAPGLGITWNGDSFDNPRLKAAGIDFGERELRDAMIAWHVLHSDLPKGLAFVATFTCPFQEEWKHLSSSRPAFYSAVDSDVTLRSYLEIERGLKERPGLWEAYDRDVIQLNPVLRSMEAAGMPINPETRLDRAIKLTDRLAGVEREIEALIPPELRKVSPPNGYVKTPAETAGMVEIEVEVEVQRCSVCGVAGPSKAHFRTLKKPSVRKPQNPCSGGSVRAATETIRRFANREPWKVSSKNLIAYQTHMGRLIPKKWDKKTGTRKPSMDKKGLKICLRKYPDDPLYSLILQHRELKKIAGTYIGYVEGVGEDE